MATESNVLLTDSKTMVTKSKIFSMSFRTQRRGDIEPPSGTRESQPPNMASRSRHEVYFFRVICRI
jgi:hypothetical protein